MSSGQDLASWARDLTWADLPPDVRTRAVLHHLSLAAVTDLGAAPDDPDERLMYLASRASASMLGDVSALGHEAWGPVLGAWIGAGQASWAEVVTATVAATEVVERVALWTALLPTPGAGRCWPVAAGVAVALGHLTDLDGDALARALGLALAPIELAEDELADPGARVRAFVDAVRAGVAAVEAAGRGEGDPAGWESGRPLPGSQPLALLPGALTALGERWLIRSLTYRLAPVAPWAQTAVQAGHEVVRRHVKAAGKRLRPDQVESVEIRMDHLSWVRAQHAARTATTDPAHRLPWSLADAIAYLVAWAPDDPLRWDPALCADDAPMALVRDKVTVVPDMGLTLSWMRWHGRHLGPLLAALPAIERLSAFNRITFAVIGRVPPPDRDALRHLWQGRKAELLELLVGTAPGDLSAVEERGMHLSRPVQLRIYTTRGGHWLERRDVVEGGPEFHLDDLRADVVAKLATVHTDAEGAANSLLAASDLSGSDALGILAS